jgi:hypothetical protein
MHPLAWKNCSGGNSGAWNEVHSGDHVIYLIDGRKGTLDECLHDGDAFITWDDGSFGMVRWYNLAPVSRVKTTATGWEAML